MRLAYTVATPDTADPEMQALRGDLEGNFRLLDKLGYEGAELMVRDPARLHPERIRRLAGSHGLSIPAVSTGQINKEDGLTLSDLDEGVRRRAVERATEVIDFAAAVGAPQINIGSMRGRLPRDARRAEAMEAARVSLGALLDHALERGVGIAMEPQNRFVINWLYTPTETVRWLEQFHQPNASIVFDAYHVLFEERSFYASLIRSFPKVSHVQVADTNRLAPGWGQFNFGELIRVLRALGYRRHVSVEIAPRPDGVAAAEQAARHLLPLLAEKEE
jgi:sugar phosphate isomerase/epimerase